MWEFSILIDKEDAIYLKYIDKKLSRLRNILVMVKCNQNDYVNLSIACEEKYKEKVVKHIKMAVADLIILIYKEKYYLSRLQFKSIGDVCEKALIKALFLFDLEDDRETILHYLKLDKTLVVKSFFDFQLMELKEKWNNIINLAQENNYYFFDTEIFLEILKFLVASIPHKHDEISVSYSGKEFIFLDGKSQMINKDDFPESMSSEIGLVSNLIFLSPRKINILCLDNISKTTFNIIYNVFNQTINLSL